MADPARRPNEVPADLDRGLLALCTRRPIALLMVVITVVVFGTISFYQLPRNLMPDISYPTITVRSSFPGAAPIDVEDRVSERLESVLSQVKSLRRISSVSRAEVSEIILEFAWGTDMGQATLEVREKIDQAVLPDEVEKPTILRYDPTLDPILQLGFYRPREKAGDKLSTEEQIRELIELRIQAEEVVEKALELVSGVAAIEVRGGFEKEIRIDVDERRLTPKEVDLELISRRLAEENQNLASGILYEGEQALIVRAVNEFQTVEEIEDIILRKRGDVPVRLADVADVYVGYKDPEVLTRYDGVPCVKIDVYKEADANLVEVAERVRERIFGSAREREQWAARLRAANKARGGPGSGESSKATAGEGEGAGGSTSQGAAASSGRRVGGSPPAFLAARFENGEELVVMSDQSVFIRQSLDEVRATAILGGLLAIVVLYLFLRNLWFTTIVGLAIPLSVIATFGVLRMVDVSLNIMSLGGLALGVGMLVDNSIVVLESIFRCREAGDAPRLAAVRGGRGVASAVVASTLTTVAVFFPIVFVEGIAGQIFRDQALTVVISLLASLAVSLTFIPTLVSRQLAPTQAPPGGWFEPRRPESGDGNRLLFPLRRAHGAFRSRGRVLFIVLLPVYAAILAVVSLGIIVRCVGVALGWFLGWLGVAVRAVASAVARRLGKGSGVLLSGFDRGWGAVERTYPRCIDLALRHRAVVLGVAMVLALGSGYLFSQLGSELIPQVHQREFTVELALPVGSRIEKTDRVVFPLERKIRQLPAVRSVAATIGVEKDSIQASEEGEHTARLLVRVAAEGLPEEVEERVKAQIRDLLSGDVQFTEKRIRSPVLFSFKTPIEVEIRGFNLQTLEALAAQVEARLREIDSIKDVKSTAQPGYPEVQVVFDREELVRYGLNIGTIGNAIKRKVAGEVPTRFTERDRKVDLRVRLREGDRSSLSDLRELIVNPDQPNKLPLHAVATLEEGEGPAEIRRIGQMRAAVVSANLAGLDLGRATEEISRVLSRVDVPAEFSVGFGGQQREMESSRQSMIRALILAVFLVYVVMAAQFESLVQPLVILFSIPLAALGIGPVLWLIDEPLSIIVFIGLIILAGIVVNNAIVLIDCINQLRQGGMTKFEAIREGGRLRLRPILMTTLTTVLGLLPLTGILNTLPGVGSMLGSVLGVGEGLEIRAPMAITVIVGLLSSTILTLIVMPVVYSLTDRRS